MRELSPDEVGALAKNVRTHRRALGLRPLEMAEYLGVSAGYLSGLELGAIARPFPNALARLARLVDLGDWTDLLVPPGDAGAPVPATTPRTAGRCPTEMSTAAAAERFIRQARRADTRAADVSPSAALPDL